MADERSLLGKSGANDANPLDSSPTGMNTRGFVKSAIDVSIPAMKGMVSMISDLMKSMSDLKNVMSSFSSGGVLKKFSDGFETIMRGAKSLRKEITSTTSSFNSFLGSAKGFGGIGPTVFQSQDKKSVADSVKITKTDSPPPSGSSSTKPSTAESAKTTTSVNIPSLKNTTEGPTDITAGSSLGQKMVQAAGTGGGFAGLGNKLKDIWAAVSGSSLEYVYNRINGPSGNMNAMLQLAQALGPNVTMMNAAGNNIDIPGLIRLLSRETPILGTQQDITQTILAGQSVGALLRGTPGRNGFFESARQMQVLNPGQAPATISGTLAGYIGNVQSQKMGAFLGEGAFTMIGQGGRYKSLAEWAHGIMEFFKQHRPGSSQGKGFSKEELVAQNFPGSNINAWFQMMGVPQNMVDYWWQYVMTDKGDIPVGEMTSTLLGGQVSQARGINLGFEQLRTSTQGSRRDFLFGNKMYPLYGVNQAANRRFNVAMQSTDEGLGQLLRRTQLGQAMAMLPTPILDMLMPFLSKIATSPVGAVGAAAGGLLNILGFAGDPLPYGDAVGGYGDTGGTTTAHLSPDLAKRVGAMMRANPNLKISSGYRDTVTQNRLRRNGHSMVGPATKSAHTRGWAVDIGPASQMGWLMKNAGKFGLQTAAGYGEPWHIQMAGTPMGDPGAGSMPVGDVLEDAGIFSAITRLLKQFIQGLISKTIDASISIYSKLITAPMSGLVSMFGNAPDYSTSYFRSEMNRQGDLTVPVASVPIPGFGFESSGSDVSLIADPNPYGDPQYLAATTPSTRAYRGGPTIVFQAPITIHGSASGIDARRMATTLIDRLEEEANRRSWLVT